MLRPSLQAAIMLHDLTKHLDGGADMGDLMDELADQARTASGGNLGRVEAMLTTQAHTLDAILHALARRSAANMGQYMDAAETYMRLALKAQAQARYQSPRGR